MMQAGDLPSEAAQAMGANRLRSFLTLLGIIIGVATLVGVVSVISGLNGWVQDKVIQLSPDVYVVTKFGIIRSREEFLEALKRRNISYEDYDRVSGLLRKAEQTAAQAGTSRSRSANRRAPTSPYSHCEKSGPFKTTGTMPARSSCATRRASSDSARNPRAACARTATSTASLASQGTPVHTRMAFASHADMPCRRAKAGIVSQSCGSIEIGGAGVDGANDRRPAATRSARLGGKPGLDTLLPGGCH